MKKPQFTHDCSNCQFLGQDKEHDYYYCNSRLPTVIARFGSEGSEYASGMESAIHLENEKGYHDYPLVKALKLARKKNLVPVSKH